MFFFIEENWKKTFIKVLSYCYLKDFIRHNLRNTYKEAYSLGFKQIIKKQYPWATQLNIFEFYCWLRLDKKKAANLH